MPVTRSIGRGRQQSTVQESSSAIEESSQSTPVTDISTTQAGGSIATTQATGTEATATTTQTETSQQTTRHQMADPSTVAAPHIDLIETRTQKSAAPRHRKATSTVKSAKAHKLAKAKEELARLQVELATARIAVIEAESDNEEDDVSVYSQMEDDNLVHTWLEQQQEQQNPQKPAVLAGKEDSQARLAPTAIEKTHPVEQKQNSTAIEKQQKQHQQSVVAPQPQPDFGLLAEAITQFAKSTRSRIMELPVFNGAHQDWLYFRAAYYETEKMHSTLENLNRLRRNLKGRAREAVEGQLITNSDPTKIMEVLESRFGRPDAIATAEIETLRALPRLTESPRDICIYSTKVSNVVATLQALNCVYYLYNPEVGRSMVEKMASTLRFKYYEFASTIAKETPELLKIEQFLKKEADICGPYAQPERVQHSQIQQTDQQKRIQRVHTIVTDRNKAKCSLCEETGHVITECDTFKEQNSHDRWDTAKRLRLCFSCLRYRNKSHSCQKRTCNIEGCKYHHNRLLHYKKTPIVQEDAPTTEAINSAWTTSRSHSFLKIVPVTASGPDGEVDTFALLDDGSTVTLIDDYIANRIGATGPIDPLRIEAINALKTGETESRRVNIVLKGTNNRIENIKARTVKNLNVTAQKVPREQIEEYRHLRDITEKITYRYAKPGILIGQDNCHLLLSTRVKKGKRNQPVASLTPLGWVLHGNHQHSTINNIDAINHLHEVTDENLDALMKQYFALDSLCVKPKKPKTDPEVQALRILKQNTVHKSDGRYETSLLWKTDEIAMPNNYENSLRRLYSIEKKLDNNSSLKQKYTEQMEALIVKGYAELAPKNSIENRTWYLPHFGVVNPMKPEKLRVVHDAAAKTKGVSLNDLLLKGPDLLQSLPGVVMRFRQHSIAVTADIKEMFMQVKLRPEDRDALRYLWRGNRRDDQPPEEYRMTSLIFGASSSPATAIYVKNANAKKYEQQYPEAVKAITEKHYVDDYLDSFKKIEDVKQQRTVNRESRLHQLSIEYVDGVLRLRSRIEAAHQIHDKIKRPIILDGNHHIVKLWINDIHRKLHHAGVEATINECRQQYWIVRVPCPITRSIVRRCLHCRMKTQVPPYPRTGDLPLCRLAHHQRPFTYTGVDYFGPLIVAVGRTNQKRYVAIYTCLTTRAIHLEIAGSLTSSSAIMTLRRMMARRGCPKEIWSDNGTNLKGADKELRQAIDTSMTAEAANRKISWRFIPPGAPFMGGAWERMVRSVKRALTATLHEKHPTEEVLTTLLAEVEYSVNSRPLTHVSVSPEDQEALTPNHFLLGGPGNVPVQGSFTDKDLLTRSNWRASQKLADAYWERWLHEYLPELQHRREPHGKGQIVKIGDLVYITDSNQPRNAWLRGKIVAVFPGPDGIVRTADVHTRGGIVRRPVRRLVILPIEDNEAPAPIDAAENRTAGEMCRTPKYSNN